MSEEKIEIICSVLDPKMIEEFLFSEKGTDTILKVISENSSQVKSLLSES